MQTNSVFGRAISAIGTRMAREEQENDADGFVDLGVGDHGGGGR